MANDTKWGEESPEHPLTWRERFDNWLDQVRFYVYAALLIALLAVGFFWDRIFITVPSGNHAVLFDRFRGGTMVKPVFSEGLHIVWPWNKLFFYETRMQQRVLTFKVLSEEGLELGISLAIRYTPIVSNLGYLHRDIGPDYFERLVKPDIEGHLRHTFGGRPAHEIYSSAREVLQEISRVPLLGRAAKNVAPEGEPVTQPYLHLEEIKLVEVALPPSLVSAINEKQKQEQLTLEYKYRLQREEKEAERKRTEAAGIRDYSVIAGKLSPEILRWRGVEAAQDLAKSTNSKLIFLGSGQGSSPITFNLNDTLPSVPPAPLPPAAEPERAAPARIPAKKLGSTAAQVPGSPPQTTQEGSLPVAPSQIK